MKSSSVIIDLELPSSVFLMSNVFIKQFTVSYFFVRSSRPSAFKSLKPITKRLPLSARSLRSYVTIGAVRSLSVHCRIKFWWCAFFFVQVCSKFETPSDQVTLKHFKTRSTFCLPSWYSRESNPKDSRMLGISSRRSPFSIFGNNKL